MPYVGIDFGTSNSVVANFRYGQAEVLPNREGLKWTPSVVTVRLNPTDSPVLAIVNATLGTTAPALSFTMMSMLPVVSCPNVNNENKATKTIEINPNRKSLFI